jgi:hypothetical protein
MPAKRANAGGVVDAAEEAGSVHVPRRQVGEYSSALVLILDSDCAAGARRLRRAATLPRLDRGLLVRRDHVLIVQQGMVTEAAGLEAEDAPRLRLEVGVARKDPMPLGLRSDGVLGQPAPDGDVGDLSDHAACDGFAAQVENEPAGEGHATLAWQLTSQRLDRLHHGGGERPPVGRGVGARPGPVIAAHRTACATC